jgi:NTE family protein
MIGTSAGSGTAAILRAGLPAADLIARAEGRPLSAAGHRLLATAPTPGRLFPLRGEARDRRYRPAAPSLVARAAMRPWEARLGAIAAGLLPAGAVPTAVIAEGLAPLFLDGWPATPLWICAVALDTGRRVVFGRDGAPDADVGAAVAASCAIPGFFTPVEIAGVRYVDGGVHSPTNADLLKSLDLDLVIISSPMSAAGRRLRGAVDAPMRQWSRWQLDREAAQIRLRRIPVIAFQPTPEDIAIMGVNAMDIGRRGSVATQVHRSTLTRLERPDVRGRLAPLGL